MHSKHKYMFDGTLPEHAVLRRRQAVQPAARPRGHVLAHGARAGVRLRPASTGRLVALTHKRASYGKDVLDLLFYYKLGHGQVHNIHQFFRAANLTPQTFNSFYMDDKNIGVFTSGLVPIRPTNVDQDLPINGTGHEEWRGWVSVQGPPPRDESAERRDRQLEQPAPGRLRGPGRQLDARSDPARDICS